MALLLWRRFPGRRACSSAAKAAVEPAAVEGATPAAPPKKKRLERMGIWFKSLMHDYAEACREIGVGMKERPVKAAVYLSLLTGAGICSHNNPCDMSYQSGLLDAVGTLLLLSPWTRNACSEGHMQRMVTLRNQGRLRYRNFVFFSLMYEAPYDPDCSLYEAHCKHLEPPLLDFPSRVCDVGFLGRWWILYNKMKDFDVNEEEFKYLPAHLQTVSSRDLHSEENEKLFDDKYKAVVMVEEHLHQDESQPQALQEVVY
ncbi:mitochondrial import inner membrane translocase subunit Tim29 [Ambystoma mexicanum]|uniref:mitochondrial import inner membrane translocase subunit Tim29 n=1 Tax=Ambystoma mexicanum TaxID=8296 RepID=UPI0037E8CAE9